MSKDHCCDMRGMLSFLILFILSKKEMSGKELSIELEKRKGGKPSPGTIYPALKSLRDNNFIKEDKKGRSIFYTLTPDGKQALKIAKEQFCKAFTDVIK